MNAMREPSPPAAPRRVLVVDDNEMNRDLLARQLARLDWACDVAASGHEALELLREASYALVLTDLQMPVMDGFELAEAIRRRESGGERRLPIVAISANGDDELIERCREADMDDYLAKPVEMRALRELMASFRGARAAAPQSPPAGSGGDRDPARPAHVLDLAVLRGLVGDDPSAVREVLDDFVPHAHGVAAEIHAAVRARAARGVGGAAHKLKSSAWGVGALGLGALCERLERAGASEDWADIEQCVPMIDSALHAVEREIEALARA